MKYLFLFFIVGFIGFAWAADDASDKVQSTDMSSEFGQGGNNPDTDFSSRNRTHTAPKKAAKTHSSRGKAADHAESQSGSGGSCSAERLGEEAKSGSKWTVSHLQCKVYVIAAMKRAGCHEPLGGAQSYEELAKRGWRCSRSSPHNAPDGAIMMYQRGRSDRHYEVKYHGCYYSDFHLADCRPASEYSSPFRVLGWCAP